MRRHGSVLAQAAATVRLHRVPRHRFSVVQRHAEPSRVALILNIVVFACIKFSHCHAAYYASKRAR